MIRLELKFKSFDPYFIQLNSQFVNSLVYFLKFKNCGQISLPTKIKKITVLRSPHIDKKSREQFQLKKYKHSMIITAVNFQDVLIFFEILKNAQLIGIELEINIKFIEYFIES